MTQSLPEKPDDSEEKRPEQGSGNRILAIGQLHYYGNDLAELRKIAEIDPVLAKKVVDQRDREDARSNASYRFGIVASLVLVGMALASVTALIAFAGLWATLGGVALIFAIALLVRVVLTGEWSDTTWFGKLVAALAKALGADTGK